MKTTGFPSVALLVWSELCLAQVPAVSVVKGLPFVADATTERTQILAGGNRIVTKVVSVIARDSLGRTRLEQTFPLPGGGTTKTIIFLTDPVRQVNYVLQPDHTARTIAMAEQPSARDQKQSSVEELGTQVMEGLVVEGTRTKVTIPAGRVGNAKPIDLSYERWFSIDLQALVASKTSDPRTGETAYQLHNIRRGEPPEKMFEVPPEYKIEEGSTAAGQF